MLLAFKPGKFFDELERISRSNRHSLQSTLSRAQQKGYVERKNGVPVLTVKGRRRIQPYLAKTLSGDVTLLVIFDIPEDHASLRQQFRIFLQNLGFDLIQRSVWSTRLDFRKELRAAIAELDIKPYVEVYESVRLALRT